MGADSVVQEPLLKIAVDAMGGDYAPREVVKGAVAAARDVRDMEIALVGPPRLIQEELNSHDLTGLKLSTYPAEEIIGMDEDPVRAIRRKQDSSIVVGMNLVNSGKAAAFVSGGSTGAVTAAALLLLGRKKGIHRPALGITFDSPKGPVLLLDVGANADCKPKYLMQFAEMGSVYMKKIYGITNPKVGLLSSGEEEFKGNKLVRSTHPVMAAASTINFIGNVEGQDLPNGHADVVVTDGFTGNVVIKLSEGLAEVLAGLFKQSPNGASMMDKTKGHILNHSPGALLLGVKGNVIITHGKSDAVAHEQAIRVAESMIRRKVLEAIGT